MRIPSPAIFSRREAWSVLPEKLVALVRDEIGLVDRLFEEYEDLLDESQHATPDKVEKAALATILHSFYNGLENIFSTIAREVDSEVPSGERSHRQLLDQMVVPTQEREAVLTRQTALRLKDFLGFRHFFRHSYSFFLEWERMQPLVEAAPELWQATRAEIERFLATLTASPDASTEVREGDGGGMGTHSRDGEDQE